MKVDHVLILAAGKGTRMGKIGKVLPKVLWPIFAKNLIELQVSFAKKLAPNSNIYANVFYNRELVEGALASLDCTILVEREILDIGGAIHNLAAKLGYQGNLLVLNGDQFLHFDPSYLEQGIEKLKEYDSLLFSYEVNSNAFYNSLTFSGDKFLGVIPNKDLPRNSKHQTYTGMSLIRLDKLKPSPGASKFFDSIAKSEVNNVGVMAVNEVEYWDFGTLDRYCDSITKLCLTQDSAFKNFLISERAFERKKNNKGNYHTDNGINLSQNFISDCNGSIILEPDGQIELPKNCVVYLNHAEVIPNKK